jgi:hypothetical protein
VLALLVVLAAACSDDDSDGSNGDGTTTTVAITTTTQPPATDQASHEIVEDMVIEATELADDLFQDPSAVEDPDNESLARLREIYTDDSPTPDGVEDQLRELARLGQYDRPAANGIFREVGVYAFEPSGQDTLRFDTCSQIDTERVDADGNVVSTEAMVRFSRGEARRIEGVWRFYGLSSDDSRVTEIEPGGASQGFCQRLTDAAPEAGQ